MHYVIHKHPKGIGFKFPTERGILWVVVVPKAEDEAEVMVYEEESALAARGLPDDVAHALPITRACRNRFGAGIVLRALRTVRDLMPKIRRWRYERKLGINAGRVAVRGT